MLVKHFDFYSEMKRQIGQLERRDDLRLGLG